MIIYNFCFPQRKNELELFKNHPRLFRHALPQLHRVRRLLHRLHRLLPRRRRGRRVRGGVRAVQSLTTIRVQLERNWRRRRRRKWWAGARRPGKKIDSIFFASSFIHTYQLFEIFYCGKPGPIHSVKYITHKYQPDFTYFPLPPCRTTSLVPRPHPPAIAAWPPSCTSASETT